MGYASVKGYRGVAWVVLDSTQTPWTLRMVGDDQEHEFDPEECTELNEDEFCPSCGQTGCGHR